MLNKLRTGLLATLAGLSISSLAQDLPELPPFPEIPEKKPVNSVPLGNADSFKEVQLDLPITPGPFQPNWVSIEDNYPGTPDWLRDGKFGIWVHFGPQAAGESGDWYARHLYKESHHAYINHINRYGHPSEMGYKDVLRTWNPDKLDPEYLTALYKKAGARFLMIQGVHHDNFDLWNSQYHPWNSVNMGPKRDLLREWADACKKHGMRYGVTFHHEYTWWWWQTAFGSDSKGDKAGVPYDGHLTLEDGIGQWWEGYDPRRLYGIDLREYQGVVDAANSPWSPPSPGIFHRHLDYCKWYATEWALRIMDVTHNYAPDFIYTDGTVEGPFTGNGTGTGYKCNAMQTVMADYYNRQLKEKGKVDAFSVIKFRHPTNGAVTTEEFGFPGGIRTDQDWIRETPIGDWFYAPGFIYDTPSVVHYIIESVSRDGNAALNICFRPDGSVDPEAVTMLEQVGDWMRVNGEGIYGSHAWKTLGEGENGTIRTFPAGGLGATHANFYFSPQDIRYTEGKDGSLYAFCMGSPKSSDKFSLYSLGLTSPHAIGKIAKITLLGHGDVDFKQGLDDLTIALPDAINNMLCPTFKITFSDEANTLTLDELIQLYKEKVAEMLPLTGYNTGKLSRPHLEELQAAITQAETDPSGNEVAAIRKLNAAYQAFKKHGLIEGGQPESNGSTDQTTTYLIESSNFTRTAETNNGKRFGAPLNWTVDNFLIQRGSEGTKNGLDNNQQGSLNNARIYRNVTLPAGRYYFGAKYETVNAVNDKAYIFVADKTLPTPYINKRSIAYLPINEAVAGGDWSGVFFTLPQEQEVALGWQANLSQGEVSQEFRVREVKLLHYNQDDGIETPTLSPDSKWQNDIFYDLSGRPVNNPINSHQRGVYIKNGKKMVL